MNLNYDTSNLVVFQFPRYAGGKFVQNCLGLSDHMVFQKQSLAQAQIDGNFSFEDKKEYILEYQQQEDIKVELLVRFTFRLYGTVCPR